MFVKALSTVSSKRIIFRPGVPLFPGKIIAAALVMFFGCTSPVLAGETVITATVADTATMTLLIEGVNLPQASVYMGRVGGGVEKLETIRACSTSIETRLPTSDPGTYIVALALSRDRMWTSVVTVGAIGPQGPQGPQGPAGPAGMSGYTYKRFVNFSSVPPDTEQNALAMCPDGKKILSGGWQETTGSGDLVSIGSYPSSDFTWNTRIKNTGTVSRSYSLYYICADITP